MNMENINIGDKLFFRDSYGSLCFGTVKSVEKPLILNSALAKKVAVVRFDEAHIIDGRDGEIAKNISHSFSSVALAEDCFGTFAELRTHIDQIFTKDKTYCEDEIKDVKGLVKFALSHELFGENTDLAAKAAFITRASALLNIPEEELRAL